MPDCVSRLEPPAKPARLCRGHAAVPGERSPENAEDIHEGILSFLIDIRIIL